MKTKIMKKYTLILALIIFSSCKEVQQEQMIYFEEAQPINNSELRVIPSKFIGTYVSNDSVFLNIDKNTIYMQNNYHLWLHKNQLDSLKNELRFKEGRYILTKTNEVLESKKFGDSILFIMKDRDTIFEFSEIQKAKKINGKLIVSTKDSIYWRVKVLRLEPNGIRVQDFYADTDLKIFHSLTIKKSEAIQELNSSYLVKPSRKEFVKILKIKDLGKSTIFISYNSK